MVELTLGLRTVDLPYQLKFYDVTEEIFDELVDEDTKAELLDGVMTVHSPASPQHNALVRFLLELMSRYAEEKDLGELFGPEDLVRLATGRKFAPDLFFLEKGYVPLPLPAKQFEGPPDMVIEVLSPSNRSDDLDDKRPAYREAGVREMWFVDPDRKEIIVDRRRKKTYATSTLSKGQLISIVVPGFWIEISWLWTQPLPRVMSCLKTILK